MKDLQLLRKRLLYISQHQGMREMDMVLGQYAEHHLNSMNKQELGEFEALLNFPDGDLYGWFFEGKPTPEGVIRSLVGAIIQFRHLEA